MGLRFSRWVALWWVGWVHPALGLATNQVLVHGRVLGEEGDDAGTCALRGHGGFAARYPTVINRGTNLLMGILVQKLWTSALRGGIRGSGGE